MTDNPSIVQEDLLFHLLESTKKKAQDPLVIDEILLKTKEALSSHKEYVQGLSLEDTATLLNMDAHNSALMEKLFSAALEIKKKIYGNRIVLFAPLYVSNWCLGSCAYCGFRKDNVSLTRKILSKEEIIQDVEALQKQGHKRILMLMGEHPQYPFEDFLKAMEIVAEVKSEPSGEVRRINVEIPSLKEEEFQKLKDAPKLGTYTLFQETYHKKTYQEMHPSGPKSNYEWRLSTMDRAQRNGIKDVGVGALFGLFDYRFEVLALLMHANHLDQLFGSGPHTVSIPRIQPATATPLSLRPPAPVSDPDFKKIVAILRCAIPYTGIILSTRESPEMRKELYSLGVSQISAGSKTHPGGYSQKENELFSKEQFSLSDMRPSAEVIRELLELGYIPSWCTACYRLGRVGKDFMEFAKKGTIHLFCQPNALLTLAEYLIDYADENAQKTGWALLEKEKERIEQNRRASFEKALKAIQNKKRDLYF